MIRTVLLFVAALASARLPAEALAPGSFQAALSEYRAGNFAAAHAAFLSLAELGDCSAQFNLAAMALHGQGGPQDAGSGAGWLEAAGGNGCGQLVGNSLKELTPKLSPEETRSARDIVARYGPQALRAQGVVEPEFICSDRRPPRVVSATTAETPARARGREPAFVITALTIGADGHARDPELLLARPDDTFVAASVEAWLNSQFEPAQRGASAVPARLEATSLFVEHGSLTDADFFRRARSAADAGDPAAEYLVGLAATHNGSLGISEARARQLLLEAARDGNPDAQYWVGSQLRASAACHPAADGAVWLRHAADGGNSAAQLLLAQDLLADATNASQLARARALLGQASGGDSYYVRKHVVALLATSPVDAVRDAPAALELARRLAAFNITTDPQMYEAVAAAFAANGDFRNATAQQQLAMQKASALGWDTHLLSEQLDAYRHDRAWRGELLASF